MKRICGIDEAGRGPLAGPLVAAAVVVPEGFEIMAVDSKRLSEKRRGIWRDEFANFAGDGIEYAYEIISVDEINEQGIEWANQEIFRRLVLRIEADVYLIDGNRKLKDLGEKEERCRNEVRGDERIPVIAAASILAKTRRDLIMRELALQFPQYHWDRNKGYGTKQHLMAIKKYGSTPYHRGKFMDTVKKKSYSHLFSPEDLAKLA